MARVGIYPAKADDLATENAPLAVVGALGTPVASGVVSAAAPAAATVLSDTGPLAAGVYKVNFSAAGSGPIAAGIHIEFQHRNAANAANVMAGPICPMGLSLEDTIDKIVVAANERFRFITVGAAPASSVYGTRIDAIPLPVGA